MRKLIILLVFLPSTVVAEAYQRPIPQAQSATAELWFGIASVALILALFVVNWLVRRP